MQRDGVHRTRSREPGRGEGTASELEGTEGGAHVRRMNGQGSLPGTDGGREAVEEEEEEEEGDDFR